jgi:hypothetical protein
MPVSSYIVRIYRKGRGQFRLLVGVVEEVGAKGKRAFTNFDELREILSRKHPRQLSGRKGSGAS